jgi:hypothetical protein
MASTTNALVVDRNAYDVESLRAKELHDERIAGLLDCDHRPGVEQHAGDEVDGMSRA